MICKEYLCESDIVCLLGDLHIGAKNAKKKQLKKAIAEIKKNGWHVIIMGDICENTPYKHKFNDPAMVDPEFAGGNLVGKQYDFAEELLRPIKDQILFIHCGNHDQRLANQSGVDEVARMCTRLGVQYAEYSAFSRLKYIVSGKSQSYDIYSAHGYASGRQRGGKVNALEQMLGYMDFDVAAVGHSHDLFHTSQLKMYLPAVMKQCDYEHHYSRIVSLPGEQIPETNLREKEIFFCNTGSFLPGTTDDTGISYAEVHGYRLLKCGYTKITFGKKTHSIKVEEVVV